MKTETQNAPWNITRIIVGHDSNYGEVPKPDVLIAALEHHQQVVRMSDKRKIQALVDALEAACDLLDRNGHYHVNAAGGLYGNVGAKIDEALTLAKET